MKAATESEDQAEALQQPQKTPADFRGGTDSGGSTLITEPLQQSEHAPIYRVDGPRLNTPSAPPKKPFRALRSIVTTLVIVALAYAAYVYVFDMKVFSSNLLEESFGSTSYLRPKQWSSYENGESQVKLYGDHKARDGKSQALVMISVNPQAIPVSTSDHAALRSEIVKQFSPEALEAAWQGGTTGCESIDNVTTEPDTKENETAIGMVYVEATCKKTGATFRIKMHGIIGRDGYFRLIGVLATDLSWKINEGVYQKMIDSISETSAAV